MHKKGSLNNPAGENGYLVGSKLAKESGFHSDKVEISYQKIDPKELPGKLHIHKKMDEIVIVLAGRFVVEMDGEKRELNEKEFVFKTAGSPGRALAADPDTEILIIKTPSVANDIQMIDPK